MRAGGIDHHLAPDLALAGADACHSAVLEVDPLQPDPGRKAYAMRARPVLVCHGEIVGLQIAVAGAP